MSWCWGCGKFLKLLYLHAFCTEECARNYSQGK